jgi:hypothetical protein
VHVSVAVLLFFLGMLGDFMLLIAFIDSEGSYHTVCGYQSSSYMGCWF